MQALKKKTCLDRYNCFKIVHKTVMDLDYGCFVHVLKIVHKTVKDLDYGSFVYFFKKKIVHKTVKDLD